MTVPQTLLILAFTGALSAGLTFALIHLSTALKLVAQPTKDRWHKIATPNTGGIAVVVSCSLALLVFTGARSPYSRLILIALPVSVFGVVDDRLRLAPWIKLLAQSAAALAVLSGGSQLNLTSWPMLNMALTYVWLIGITNAFNLIDNMDGLCAGVVVITCGFRFVTALQTGDAEGARLLAVLIAGYAGFLIFNYRPARIFMGDGGSMFAGFTLASIAVVSPIPHTRVVLSGLLYPALTFLYPIFDTTLVSVFRRLAGRSVSVGGRDHSSHRLASIGIGEQKAVWILWGLAAVGSGAGIGGVMDAPRHHHRRGAARDGHQPIRYLPWLAPRLC